MSVNWIVSQIGARQHYGVPRGLLHRDELRLLYTDAWCSTGQSWLRLGPGTLKAFAGRSHPDIPRSKVISFNVGTLRSRLLHGEMQQDVVAQHLQYLRFGKWFSSKVAEDLKRRKLRPGEDHFFGFNTACLETMAVLRERQILSVVDQIDPARVEEQLIHEEAQRWPGWQKLPGRIPDAYWERMYAEWAAATIVLVNSGWTRRALITQGVPAEKIVVIPPPYEPEKLRLPARNNMDQPLTVLWLGLVNLRKGIQYLIEAAKLLERNSRVRFVIAGPIQISDDAVKSAPPNMQFLGRITRLETGELYRKADLFVLPTLSDGFAVSQLEAMSQALPVISTPNCGEVVTPGRDGLIVPAYNAEAIAEAIQKLDDDRQLLREMSYRAISTSTNYYLPRQALMLDEAVSNFRQGLPLNQMRYQIAPDRQTGFSDGSPMTGALPQHRARVAMIQDGARRRYMVPLGLQRAGILERVYIDWLVRDASVESMLASAISRVKPKLGRRMRERACPELEPRKVISNWMLALQMHSRMAKYSVEEDAFLYASHRTARWILKEGFGNSNVLYGFIRNAAPELFREARRQGIRTCGDQIIAPYQVEINEMAEQQRRWPGWSKSESTVAHKEYLQFEQETWDHLDLITCMSDYVKDGLVEMGVAANRIKVIPYPWNQASAPAVERDNRTGPLTVGFVGQVGLRKGAPYFLEVAKRFDPKRVKFVMVGKVVLNKDNLQPYQDHVEFTGSVARSQVKNWLSRFDIFFFPSTCEGSAGAVIEAMASGLPVLTTRNSGSSARHGLDGFIYRYDEIDQFESAIRALDADRDLMHQMGRSARRHTVAFDLNAYSRELNQTFLDLIRAAKL